MHITIVCLFVCLFPLYICIFLVVHISHIKLQITVTIRTAPRKLNSHVIFTRVRFAIVLFWNMICRLLFCFCSVCHSSETRPNRCNNCRERGRDKLKLRFFFVPFCWQQ
uniref:(northern house mosquito) hypothetical protein n=1 Tax=Culex pipiens TaxID=7175 RepID=A0A8D8BWV2_CULPI